MSRPTVGDLFCGAGGFSEGFRQAGFEVKFAFDDWKPAYDTYRNNFPGTKVITDDILSFDFKKEAHRLGRVDVLIGSPPCQPFSLANRGGNGDSKGGLALVAKFLEAVKHLGPRYWIMENVPNIERTLREAWLVDRKHIRKKDVTEYLLSRRVSRFDCSRYGVPQKRTRLFSGEFPAPVESQLGAMTLSEVVEAFPYPEPRKGAGPEGVMTDPLYGISIPYSDLRDHFMDSSMDDQHVRISRREKEDHNWAGKMSFPDDLQSPSRTICATSVKSGRQAIVIRDPRKARPYRTPTIRECATLQGFPVSYQFWGSTLTQKQTMIGNAVPPPMARSLAIAILDDMGRMAPHKPQLSTPRALAPEASNGHNRLAFRFPLHRTYRHKVPGTIASCRVDFDNQGNAPLKHPCGAGGHLREWRAMIYLGYAKEYASWPLSLELAERMASTVFDSTLDSHFQEDVLSRTIREAARTFAGKIPDASSLQAIWANRLDDSHGPDWVLETVGSICKASVGEPSEEIGVKAKVFARDLKGVKTASHGDDYDFDSGRWREEPVNLYTVCSAVALAVAATLANEGVEWLRDNWGRHYDDLSVGAVGPFPDRLRDVVDADLLRAKAFA
jgi:DNA (cytosine-5)-methyltransferase 1